MSRRDVAKLLLVLDVLAAEEGLDPALPAVSSSASKLPRLEVKTSRATSIPAGHMQHQ